MKSKKAMEFEVLVKALIVIVVLIISIAIYVKYTNKGAGILDKNINNVDSIVKGSPSESPKGTSGDLPSPPENQAAT